MWPASHAISGPPETHDSRLWREFVAIAARTLALAADSPAAGTGAFSPLLA
jgi:hypothetical protein